MSRCPPAFVNTAWYSLPFCPAVVDDTVSVVDAAPEMFVNVAPPLVDTCHWTVGAGLPEAAAVKVAVAPALTVTLVGCVVTAGGKSTVRVNVLLVTLPTEFVTTARYCVPFSAAAQMIDSEGPLPPETFENAGEAPPAEDCHCTDGGGLPATAIVTVTVAPALHVRLVGCVTIVGAKSTVRSRAASSPCPPSW